MKVRFSNVFHQDMSPFEATALIDRRVKKEFFLFTYYGGKLIRKGVIYDAEYIDFFGAGIQLLTLESEEEEENLQNLLCEIKQWQKRKSVLLMLRQLIYYLYFAGSFGFGLIFVWCALLTNLKGCFGAFYVLVILRCLFVLGTTKKIS